MIPAGIQPFLLVENPDELTDLPAPYAAIPPQQFPFYDGFTPILAPSSGYFADWMAHAMTARSFRPSQTVEAMTWFDLPARQQAAYDAPFPSRPYMAGARVFPSLINEVPGTTAQAWAGLNAFHKPFLTIWASNDPGQLGSCLAQQVFIDNVPAPQASRTHVSPRPATSSRTTRENRSPGDLSGGTSSAPRPRRGPRGRTKRILVKVEVKAREDQARISGTIKVNATYKLKTRTRSVAEGTRMTLKLKPRKKRQARRIARALKNGKKAKAKLTVELSDETGNEKTVKLGVKLKR